MPHPRTACTCSNGRMSHDRAGTAAQAELDRRGREVMAIAEHADQILFLYGTDWSPIYVNPAYETVFGRTVEDWLRSSADSDMKMVHPEDVASVEASLGPFTARVQRGDSDIAPIELVYRIVRADGSTVWVQSMVFSIADERGAPYRIGGLGLDVTRSRQLLDDAVRTRDAAEEWRRRMTSMLARATTRVRQPLGSARDLVDQLSGLMHDDPDSAREVLRQLKEDLSRALHTVDDFDQLVHLRRPDSAEVDVQDEVARAVDSARRATSGTATVSVSVPPQLRFHTDEDLLQLALAPMLGRALSVASTITISAETDGDALSIRVRDNGPPIAAELLPLLLQPFAGSDDHRLGLANAAAERLGGSIDALSHPTAGCILTLRLPSLSPGGPAGQR